MGKKKAPLSEHLIIRVTPEFRSQLTWRAKQLGYPTRSKFILTALEMFCALAEPYDKEEETEDEKEDDGQ